jgi:serine O-acetyltransferase
VNLPRYRHLVMSDLYRIDGDVSMRSFLKQVTRGLSFKFIFWMRTAAILRTAGPGWRMLYPVARAMYRRYMFKFGISIPYQTPIGSGFYIGHFGGIVVSSGATIGANCNISQGVTIGQINRGAKKGTPHIGDNVYIGPGAKVLGHISIGNNVAIGANAVVINDVPDNAVVVGVPARLISHDGSADYINRTDYPAEP